VVEFDNRPVRCAVHMRRRSALQFQ
jgi:hypothetical protein